MWLIYFVATAVALGIYRFAPNYIGCADGLVCCLVAHIGAGVERKAD